jgi:vacuolar-type H+-ATPase subunit I/STV1
MAERGHTHPYIMALVVGVALLLFAGLCLSLAGVVRPIPYAQYVLASFALALSLRGLLFSFLKPYFVGNSDLFWYLSSAFCLALASLIFKGLRDVWN